MDSVPGPIRMGSILAWFGALISIALVSHEGGLASALCPARGGCETVLSSPFASIRGIPLPIFGTIFFLTQLALWLAVYAISAQKMRLRLLDAALWLVIAGATFSTGLMVVQFGVLRAFCPLCTASALTTIALLIVAMKARGRIAAGAAAASTSEAVTLAVFAILPAGLLLASSMAPGSGAGRAQLVELSPGHRTGPADAAVQIHVFSDFQCNFCGQLAPILARLAGEYPRDLAITYRHFPLAGHSRAFDAAVAAECAAEQNAFQRYAGKLYAEGGELAEKDFIALAVAAGLDEARFTACLRSEAPRKIVEANARDAVRLDLEGVPAVFIDGRRVRGVLDYESLRRQIQRALPKSDR
jgi:protein-disulfide isomerase